MNKIFIYIYIYLDLPTPTSVETNMDKRAEQLMDRFRRNLGFRPNWPVQEVQKKLLYKNHIF